MKKLTVTMTLAALFALPALAQTSGAGEDRAETSARATAADKAAAKSVRKTEGRAVARTAGVGDAEPGNTRAAPTTKAQRKAAAAKRKAEGVKATGEPKDASGPN